MSKYFFIVFSIFIFVITDVVEAASAKAKITGRDCKRLLQHQARSDVKFKPGLDVRGRKVAGADLNNNIKLKLPSTVEFNIAFNPLKGSAASRFGETSAGVGRVKYDMNKNSFTFNGQPMNARAIGTLAKQCKNAAK